MATPYEVFMLILCCVFLAMLALEYLAPLSEEDREILLKADIIICLFFFTDFLISFWQAPNKLRYMVTWGWLDLLSSIPVAAATRWSRLARVARILRLLRGVRSLREIVRFLGGARRAESTVFAALLLGAVLLVFFTIAIIHLEGPTNGGFEHAADAIWWTLVTATSVGYGDLVPQTNWGRLVGAGVALVGVGLFGVFTAFLATWLLAPGEDEQEREMEAIRHQLVELRTLILAQHEESRMTMAALSQPEQESQVRTAPLRERGRARY